MNIYICVCIHICIYVYVYIYIYIYIYNTFIHIQIQERCVYICIHVYKGTHIQVYVCNKNKPKDQNLRDPCQHELMQLAPSFLPSVTAEKCTLLARYNIRLFAHHTLLHLARNAYCTHFELQGTRTGRGGGLGSSTIKEVGGWGRVPFSRI